MTDWETTFQQLLEGQVEEVKVPKEDFLFVRTMLIEKGWLFEVVGEAKHGGITIYRKNSITPTS
ncbi:MAG: hypothetical protein WBV10_10830 [Exiguobacterium marinum]|uniref:Uncharacterized protein n=1 Tax=Exiguobacterium marinum TaxID=273528 RepID=A0ABY7X149_9BACL|nr:MULTISPECIES: hypothetical protein [Exiguobacterium]WDH76852.1 hypothetical protein PTI97_04890 [Exiguobacterium marinum]